MPNKPALQSCGFLIIRGNPVDSFLLMRHADRWDLPKGHVDPGETELECAYREVFEETGIRQQQIKRIDGFCYRDRYIVNNKRTRFQDGEKELVIFLGRVDEQPDIVVTEHLGHEWFPWSPPHRIQALTVDKVLAAAEEFFGENSNSTIEH